jgi:hypothetical protein
MVAVPSTSTRSTTNARVAPDVAPSEPTAPAANASSEESGTSAPTRTADSAASTQHVSRGGLVMRFLQRYEDRHPEEAKQFLSGVADKLRADAQEGGPWADRLNAWADKFDQAAQSGDLSNLLPDRPHAHFGVRAYQRAQASERGELSDVAHAVAFGSKSLTITTTTTTKISVENADAPASAPTEAASAKPEGPPIFEPSVA